MDGGRLAAMDARLGSRERESRERKREKDLLININQEIMDRSGKECMSLPLRKKKRSLNLRSKISIL